MTRGTKAFIAIIACAVLAVVVFFVVDMSGGRVFATPQECFEAATASLKKNDMAGFFECLTEDSRDLLAATTIINEHFQKMEFETKASDEQKAQIKAVDAVFAKHGLTDEFLKKSQREMMMALQDGGPMEDRLKAAQILLQPVRDRAGFFADVTKAAKIVLPFRNAKLSDVQISGKNAMGEMTVPGDRPRPMIFRKEGEGWRMDLFPQMPQPRMPQGLPPGHPPM